MIVRQSVCRTEVAWMTSAMRPYLISDGSSTRVALELSRNAVGAVIHDELTMAEALRTMLNHRIREFGLKCGDVDSCVRLGADAWNRAMNRNRRIADAENEQLPLCTGCKACGEDIQ